MEGGRSLAGERRWNSAQLESALTELKSVTAARAVLGEDGSVKEIHLVVEADRNPKQVVRDVETTLQAQFRLVVDHRKISVAQKDLAEKPADFPRLRWVDVEIAQVGTRAKVTVMVERAGKVYTGTELGVKSTSNVYRLVATACLRAVEAAHGLHERFALDDLNASVMLAGRPVVVAMISAVGDQGEDVLIGSAIVRQDPQRAVIAATLDALNRRVLNLPADLAPIVNNDAIAVEPDVGLAAKLESNSY